MEQRLGPAADAAQFLFNCDGEGHLIGGIAAVPGFGWWPIKVYRPCPSLSDAGIEYTRKGQALNEVLFGGVSLSPDAQRTLVEMQRQADRGLDVTQQIKDVKEKDKKKDSK